VSGGSQLCIGGLAHVVCASTGPPGEEHVRSLAAAAASMADSQGSAMLEEVVRAEVARPIPLVP